MRIVFNRSYLCCGCKRRVVSADAAIAYRGCCICSDCYGRLDRVSPKSTFEAKGIVEFVSAAFYYTEMYRSIFLEYKFWDMEMYGHIIGIALREYFSSFSELGVYDFIAPVPLSSRRMKQRGFNQTDIFAQYISQAIDVPVRHCIKRVRDEMAQSTLSAVERAVNVRKAFSCSEDLSGMKILIVDDVFTTGNTMNECAKALCQAGAEKIGGAVAAYVYRKQNLNIPLPRVMSEKYRKHTVIYHKGT